MKNFLLVILLAISTNTLIAQSKSYQIQGQITNMATGEPVVAALVLLNNSDKGAISDSLGNYLITDVAQGIHFITVSRVGYKETKSSNFQITLNNRTENIELETSNLVIDDVIIKRDLAVRDIESPVSVNVVSIKEIEKSPGTGRDIARVVSTMPGVGGVASSSYRNDLSIRGGATAENAFYLDGVKISNINHFSTQGASGGPVSMIDADLVREIKIYTGAFPANRGGGLSSVMDFKLKDGTTDGNVYRAIAGTSELALSSNGAITPKILYNVSIRYSYLQTLFKVLDLPFLPQYTDSQFKIRYNIDRNNELVLMGVGAIDDIDINNDADKTDPSTNYIVTTIPHIKQKGYTLGATYKRRGEGNNQFFVLSHNLLDNRIDKYTDNIYTEENKVLDYHSDEIETHFRAENNNEFGLFKLNSGVGYDYNIFKNDSFIKIFSDGGSSNFTEDERLRFSSWSAFASLLYESTNGRYSGAFAVRLDGNSLTSYMSNPFNQFSPRLSGSYMLTDKIYLNGSIGRYFQIPSYTILGYNNGYNLSSETRYMSNFQTVLGAEYKISRYSRVTAEGYYKIYRNTPMSTADGIPVYDKGADYGVIGNEPVSFDGKSRAYGMDFSYRLSNTFMSITANYSIYKSEYLSPLTDKYTPTLWDTNHTLTVTAGYSTRNNWDFGLKFSFVGASPYTPYDFELSSLIDYWDTAQEPAYDYSLHNSERGKPYYQIDLRVDKSFYFKNWMLGIYFDMQNVTASASYGQYTPVSTGVVSTSDPTRYIMDYFTSESGTSIPMMGIIVEF